MNYNPTIPPADVPDDDTLLQRTQAYSTLQGFCCRAAMMEEEALLGCPREIRMPCAPECAPFDPANFEKWRDGAKMGIPDGIYIYGKVLLRNGAEKQGQALLEHGAAMDHARCQRELGCYLIDKGEVRRGLELLLHAVQKQDAVACSELSERYREGRGLPKSWGRFIHYRKLAARYGHFGAQWDLDKNKEFKGYLRYMFE